MGNDCLVVRYRGRRIQMTRHPERLSVKAFIDVEIESTFCPESHDLNMKTALTWHRPTMEETTNFILFPVSIILKSVNGPKLRMDNYHSR